jgi:hypothetical protein
MKKAWILLLFLSILLSISPAQDRHSFEVDVSIDKGDDATYYGEEYIYIYFRVTGDAYIVIYNIDTKGDIKLVYPEPEDNGFVKANSTYQIPRKDDEYYLRVNGPPGEEFICAVASENPLNIPSILYRGEEETSFRIEGDVEEAIEALNDDIIANKGGVKSVDVCHFYVDMREDKMFPPPPQPPFLGSIVIKSRPPNAKIYFDGRYFGKTPAVIGGIPPGKHNLELSKRGYYRYEEEVVIDEGEREAVSVNLKWRFW